MVTSRKATINSQRDIKLDMWTPAGYVTICCFCQVLRSFAGDKRDSQKVTVSPRIQWLIISGPNGIDSKAIENGFFGRSIAHNETVLQNPFLTILESHQKNLCRLSNKCWGLEDDTEDLVSIATNGYGVKLCAFV